MGSYIDSHIAYGVLLPTGDDDEFIYEHPDLYNNLRQLAGLEPLEVDQYGDPVDKDEDVWYDIYQAIEKKYPNLSVITHYCNEYSEGAVLALNKTKLWGMQGITFVGEYKVEFKVADSAALFEAAALFGITDESQFGIYIVANYG